jgi:hypothetical protein
VLKANKKGDYDLSQLYLSKIEDAAIVNIHLIDSDEGSVEQHAGEEPEESDHCRASTEPPVLQPIKGLEHSCQEGQETASFGDQAIPEKHLRAIE